MPVKCSFCRRRYVRAGAYETHLRIAHANLDIVLASTTQNPTANLTDDAEPNIYNPNGQIERADSDYESEQVNSTVPYECDGITDTPTNDSNLEANNGNTSDFPRQTDYPQAGEAIGDVQAYDEDNRYLCENPWAPFTSGPGFKLASWFIESKVPKSRINDFFTTSLGDAACVGYSSMHTLQNHLRRVDPYGQYLQWFEGKVEFDQRTLPFFYRNILDCVRYLLCQIAYRDDLVYAPRREYDFDGQRVFSEMHTADWWWDVQVNI